MASKFLQWLKGIVEEQTPFLLVIVAFAVLALEASSAVGLWNLPWFQSKIAEITLALLSVFALGIASQQLLLSKRLNELSEIAASQADLSAKLQAIGISDMWAKGVGSVAKWRELRKEAKRLSIASISAYSWAYGEINALKHLLVKEGCHMRILLATPGSDFVSLREEREGKHRRGAITNEINATVGLFKDIIEEAGGKIAGSLEIRFCKSDIPCRVEIVNDSVIHWTPHILPARASYMPAFEVQSSASSTASKLLLEYFEMLWKESEATTVFKWPT